MSLTEEKCFEIAIRIVTQHNKEDLLNTFQIILEKLFIGCQNSTYDIVDNEFTEPPSEHNEILQRAILSQQILFDEDLAICVFPISSLGKIKHLILLQGQAIPARASLLQQLMDLFNNQQLLLDNNNHDALTGLLNRHSFEDRISNLIDNFQRRGDDNPPQYCFAILDIDFFKNVNDNFGHLYGDEVLILFSNIMETTFRHDDMLFRYGGEEFAVLLRDIELNTAITVLNRFRENIAKYDFPQVGSITVSLGVTEITASISRVDIISQADQALYFSKENGRNQVNSYEELISTEKLVSKSANTDDIELF